MKYQEDKRLIEETLIKANFIKEISYIHSVGHGKNNRAYCVSSRDKNFFAKFYYFAESDKRNRLETEFKFLDFAREKNITCVPETILKADSINLGIFEFIEGKKLLKDELNLKNVMLAANFFKSLNLCNDNLSKINLNYASEAFLNLDNYITLLDNKILLLNEVALENKEKLLIKFINDLQKIWKNVKERLIKEHAFLSNEASLCVSPSDFGFHNALQTDRGLYFLDFEYAGLDDSSKFISDFFIQPEIPVPHQYFEEFSLSALERFPDKDRQFERTLKLFPMFQVKWCCIILNEFLPNIVERRVFSNPSLSIEDAKKSQLDKAQTLLLKIN